MGIQPSRRAFLETYVIQTNYTRIGLKTTLYNGFEIVGTSAPADVRAFNKELGIRYAYEDALTQMDSYFAFLQQDRDHIESVALSNILKDISEDLDRE